MKWWVNSNTGDYIKDDNGVYKLYLIPRYIDSNYLPGESIDITQSQFKSLKGFVPIKEKNLFSRNRNLSKYSPTLSGGIKGNSERIKVPEIHEIRDEIIRSLGI
jgi:hypothetical protein